MESSPTNLLSIGLLNYPQNILVPSAPFVLKLGLTSLSPNPEKFKLGISGTGVEFQAGADVLDYQEFAPQDQREVGIEITPTVDGQVRIDFAGYREIRVEEIVREQKIRPASPRQTLPQVSITPWEYAILPAQDEIIDMLQEFPVMAPPPLDEVEYQAKYADAAVLPDQNQKDQGLIQVAKTFGPAAPNVISLILAEVSNPALVQQALQEIIPDLVLSDHVFATQLVASIQDPMLRDQMYSTVAIQVTPRSADDAVAIAQQISNPDDRDNTLIQIANMLVGRDHKKAAGIIEQIQNPDLRVQGLGNFAQQLIGRDLDKAYDLASKIPDPAQKDALLGIIAQQYALKKPKKAGQVVQEISNPNIRSQVLFQIIQYLAVKDLKHAAELAQTHPDPDQRDQIIANICRMAMQNDVDLAKSLQGQIQDFSLKIQVMLEIASSLSVTHPRGVESIITTILDQIQLNSPPDAVDLTSQAITRYADDVDPSRAEILCRALDPAMQEQVSGVLFDHLYVLEETIKTRIDDELTVQIFFVFNSLVSHLAEPILEFVYDGGNASNNVLGGQYNSNIAIFTLFGQSFPLFPIMERIYTEFVYLQQKSFFYFLYPMRENLSDREENILTAAIQRFWVKPAGELRGQVFVFNMDFIPQQASPTIIIGSDPDINIAVETAIKRSLGSAVEVIIDEGLFSGGKMYDFLTQLLPPAKFKVINIVLTYDFLSSTELFRNFVQAFVK